nr:T9SS type A sorting domain-containing protein [uncultured Psychroserpens sp.]
MKTNYSFFKKSLFSTVFWCLFILSGYFSTAQNLNFTIDTAVDNGTTITESISIGGDTYVLTIFHPGNEELDDLGGGDLVFYHSATDPLIPYTLTITKDMVVQNFNLNSIDYDTLGQGTIALANQDDAEISQPTTYNLGAGTLAITNPANALNISQIKIIPTGVLDLNNFGFHNINVDLTASCEPPAATAVLSSQDCTAGNFLVDINVTDLGNGTPAIFDGTTTTPIASTGVINLGPYPIGTPVSFTLQHGNDVSCDVVLGTVSDTCPPPCISPEGTATLTSQDCTAETFQIDVNVTSLGSGSPAIFDGTTSIPVTVTGVTTLGPYPIGTPITVTLQHGNDNTCDVDLGIVGDTCSELIFTIDTAVDNGTNITETIIKDGDTYVLTVDHSGSETLDDLGGGDLVFYLGSGGANTTEPFILTITRNGNPTNFTLKGLDYDTPDAGSISILNQDDQEISANTVYALGAGAIAITNTANAADISAFKILPTDSDDLNDFGFHNIKVDIATACDASFSYSASAYCADGSDPTATVTGTPGGTFSSGAGLSINASTGTIDVSASTPGTYTVTYTASGACSNDVNITVNALDDASFSYDAASYCQSDVDPTATVSGLAGGTFSSSAGLSINAATGAIDVSASTPGIYTVTYTTAGTCPNSSNVSVTVNALDDASFSYDAASYCQSDVDPTATISGLAGGTFSSSAGLSINAATGAIDVSASTLGTYTVTYTTAGTCSNSSSVSVTVNTLDDASFSYDAASYCQSDVDPTATVSGLAGGTFSSSAGLSINTATGAIDVSASTPGTYTVTYTTAGTCPNSSNVSVTVNALDDASFSYDAASYCQSDVDPTATISGLTGGTFSSSAGLSINAATGAIDVSVSTPGTYTVTYTTAGTCSNSSSVSVTVNTLDDASFSYDAVSYCVDDTDPTATISGLAGGTFSSSAGLSINAATGVIDVSVSTPGTYTVTYTTAGTCSNSSSVSVTVNALDDASFNYDATSYCVDDTDPTPTITGLTGGTFSSGAGLSINASSGAIDNSASTPGSYTVTYTTAGICPNSSSVSIKVDASCVICTTYTSQDTPADIDPGATQTTDCENAPNFYGVALPFLGEVGTDVRIDQVMVDISHTFSGDISLILEDDQGNFIFLAENLGGATDDAYNSTIFQDGGADITMASAPFGEASYAASGGNFNDIFDGVFIGDDTVWNLLICDNAGDDTGTVNDFSITFCEIEKTLNVSDNELLQNIKLYPNPANTIVQFSAPIDSYEVYNLIGQKVLSGSEQYIDVHTLNEGMYLVTLTKDGTLGTEQLIVKH